jgi:hypothetical protein
MIMSLVSNIQQGTINRDDIARQISSIKNSNPLTAAIPNRAMESIAKSMTPQIAQSMVQTSAQPAASSGDYNKQILDTLKATWKV